MNKIIRYADVEMRMMENEDNVVVGVPIVFNRSTDLGWFTEEIDSHALDGADMTDVVLTMNHDPNIVLARTTNGSLQFDIRNDDVFQISKIIDTTQGNDAVKLVRAGLVNKMSFAFTVDENGEEWRSSPDGKEHRIITRIGKLFDFSLVTYPAYPQTSAYARGYTDELAEAHKALIERRKAQDEKLKEILHGTE